MQVLINAAIVDVKLWHGWVRTRPVNCFDNHAAPMVQFFGLNLSRGRRKTDVETTKYICACTIKQVIDVSCIALMLCFTSSTTLWWDSKLGCFPGWQSMVYGLPGEGNQCWVDFINQWSLIYSHLLYAVERFAAKNIDNFSCCDSKLALLNWLLTQ